MANLLPTLREKKRYLTFEVIGQANCSSAVGALKDSLSGLFGVLEAANAAITPVKSGGKRCIVSVNRKYVDKTKASMIMVKKIGGSRVIMKSIGVTGGISAGVSRHLNKGG